MRGQPCDDLDGAALAAAIDRQVQELQALPPAPDLHFGRPSIPAQVEALESYVASESLDAIVISGDLSQRTRRREFARAAQFVRRCESRASTVVVPGNHDCAWWTAPMGLGDYYGMYGRYREYIRNDLEPHVRIAGATIVGLNSAHGIQKYTITSRPRDLSVVGAVRGRQWERARVAFACSEVSGGNGNAPDGWGNPSERGDVAIYADGSARFTGRNGKTAEFRKLSEEPRRPGCD